MTRKNLIPFVEWGSWGGDIDKGREAKGYSLMIVWLGLCVEICVARVRQA